MTCDSLISTLRLSSKVLVSLIVESTVERLDYPEVHLLWGLMQNSPHAFIHNIPLPMRFHHFSEN